MDERIKVYLFDILSSINEVQEHFESSGTTIYQWNKDIIVQRFVERNFEIIGEALNRILKRNASYENKITSARQIIAMRNAISHEYDNILSSTVIDVLENHIDILKEEVTSLLNEAGEEETE